MFQKEVWIWVQEVDVALEMEMSYQPLRHVIVRDVFQHYSGVADIIIVSSLGSWPMGLCGGLLRHHAHSPHS